MAKTLLSGILGLCLYVTLTNASNPVSQQLSSSIECGNLDLCPAKLRQVTESHFSIVLSENQVDDVCSKLTQALTCYNDYRAECINETLPLPRLTDDYSSLSGRHLILANQLCNNATFKQDYLNYGQCLNEIQSDSNRVCQTLSLNRTASLSDKIRKIVVDRNQTQNEEEIMLTEALMGACCTIHQYCDCLYKRNLDKCVLKSAELWRKISLEIHYRNNARDCFAKYPAELLAICVDNSNTTTTTTI